MSMDVHYSSERMDWGTPPDLFQALNDEFGFRVDAAARSDNSLVSHYYGPGHWDLSSRDALTRETWDSPAWLNPPYGREITKFLAAAYRQQQRGGIVVALIPARTDTRYWHDYVMRAREIRLIRGRVRFNGAPASAPFPSAIIVFAPHSGPPSVISWHWR